MMTTNRDRKCAANDEARSAPARPRTWTDSTIAGLKLPEGQTDWRLCIETNLYIRLRQRVHRRGRKGRQTDAPAPLRKPSLTWEYRAQVDGKRRWLSLGGYPGVSLHDARKKALELEQAQQRAFAGLADHPVLVERRQRQANKEMPTVSEAFELLLADRRLGSRRKRGEPVRERTIYNLQYPFDQDCRKIIGDLKIANLRAQDIQACIDEPRKRQAPGAACMVYKSLRGLVNFALERGYIAGADPMRLIKNPRPYVPGPPNAASDAELKEMLAVVDNSDMWFATKDLIKFQLMTGVRPSEGRLARLSYMSERFSTLSLPDEVVKTDVPFCLHLSPQVLALIKDAEKYRGESDYLFPGADGIQLTQQTVGKALNRLWQQQQDSPFRRLKPHDLRKTFRTMLSRLGVPQNIAEMCLNHKQPLMVRAYDGDDHWREKVDAWNRAGVHIQALMTGGAEVIPIFAKRA
jgi:integrase